MVARRRYPRHLAIGSLILIGLLLPTTAFVAGDEQKPSGSNERLQALLTERYTVLKEMCDTMQRSLAYGRADLADYRNVTIALHHAEAELCTTKAARIRVYEKLVEAMKSQQGLVIRQQTAGQISQWQLNEAKVATLQAQIDLERLKLDR